MKIAIFCDLLPTLINLRGHLVRAMVEIAEQVTVVAAPAESSLVEKLKEQIGADFVPVEMNRTGINPLGDLSYRNELVRFLARYEPDLTFAYQAKAAVYSSIAANKFPNIKTNVLFPGLGYLFTDNGTVKENCIRWIGRRLYRHAFRNVDQFFFQNADDLTTLRNHQIIPSSANTTIVNGSGVPLDKYEFSPPITNPVRFLYMGRLLREKGVVEFCEAARQITAARGDEVEFQILGPLDSHPSAITQEELTELCRQCGVQYLGVADDVRPFLREASVFVLPSYYMEGTPRSILEAMSMGRPIITTDSRGCREPVEAGENGILIPPRDVSALAAACDQFLKNRELIVSMGIVSRKITEQRYDVNKVNREMLYSMGLIPNPGASNSQTPAAELNSD